MNSNQSNNYNEKCYKNYNQSSKFQNEDSVNIKKRKINSLCYPLNVNAPTFSINKQESAAETGMRDTTRNALLQEMFTDKFSNKPDAKFGSGKETDANRIEFRLKQVQYGKNTVGYDNYISNIPKGKRKSFSEHPRTPDVYEEVSKRAFDGKIKAWRKQLHCWDVLDAIIETNNSNSSSNNDAGRGGGGSNIITTHSGNIPYCNINSNNHNTKKTKFVHTNTKREGSSTNDSVVNGINNCNVVLKDNYHQLRESQAGDVVLPYHIAIGEDIQAIDGYDYYCETYDYVDNNNKCSELYFIDSKTYSNHNEDEDDDDVL